MTDHLINSNLNWHIFRKKGLNRKKNANEKSLKENATFLTNHRHGEYQNEKRQKA